MKQAIIILLALVAAAGQAQVKCHIWGELRDTTQGKTVIVCPAGTDLRVSNNYITAKAGVQGRFLCNVETDKMTLYNVFLYEQYEHGSLANTEFLVENGATVTLRFDEGKWKVISGGPEQMLKVKMDAEAEKLYLGKMEEISKQAEKEIRPLVEELRKQGKNPEEDSLLVKRVEKYEEEYEKLYHAYRAWELEYYAEHPMQYALYDMADQMRYNNNRHDEQKQKLMSLYHNMYENFHPENPIHNTIRTLEAAWLLKPGKPYHDFDVHTIEGKKVQVSSLYRGKVALIDFWASWCGPCRRHSKAMIPIYEKYKDKGFTVVAIARENDPKDMIQAARQDGYPWESLIDLRDELNVWQKNGLGLGGGGMEQWGNLPQLEYTVRLWLRPDLWYSRQRKEEPRVLDSLLRAEKTSFEKQVKAIRRTLNKLAKEAQDKLLYDNQKSGKDTIYYALNLSHDTTRVYKLQEGNHTYYNSDEFLDFVLESGKQEGTFEGYLNYTVSLPRVNLGATSDLYSWHSLKEDIARLMDEHGIGHRDALWQHDMAYSDSIWEEEHSEWFSKGWAGDHDNAGLTEATIYSVPEANKPLADRLLAKTDSLAQKYTDQLQGYYYQYNYGVSFDGFTPELIRTFAPGTPSGNSIYIQHADGGYHFLVLETRGVEWIPLEWYSLKSFVNGKKTYFEGMAPKE